MAIPAGWPPSVRERARQFLALWKYYRFSRTLSEVCAPFVAPFLEGNELSRDDTFRGIALVSYWIASLEVLCEGWKELGLSESTIDGLLTESHRTTLRRYRHTVFHFQADLDETRIAAMTKSLEAIQWVFDLGSAFQAFFDRHTDGIDVDSIRSWLFESAGYGSR